MSFTVPTEAPTRITAGDTASWKISLGDYPAGEGWALSYSLNRRGSGLKILIAATASSNDHLVSVTPTTTATWLAGDYDAQAYVTKAPDRYLVWVGLITILPNLATLDDSADTRTTARKTFDAIEAAILKVSLAQEAGTAGGITEWSVEGMSIKRGSAEELLRALIETRDRYATIVQNEDLIIRRASGRATGRRILTRFTHA